MSDNVVTLRGEGTVEAKARAIEPNATLVLEIERLLAAARAGELVGLAGAYVHRDRGVSYSFAGAVGGYAMLGGLDCVRERLLRAALAGER